MAEYPTEPPEYPSSYKDRLAYALALTGLPKAQVRSAVSKAVGVTTAALGQVLNYENRALSAEHNARVAKFCRVDPTWLATGEGSSRPRRVSSEAMDVAEHYDRLSIEERKKFWLLLRVVSAPVSDDAVDKLLPEAPIKGGASGEGNPGARYSRDRAAESEQ